MKALETKNIFDRERKEMETRALAIVLYHMGLSLRDCEEVLSSREQVSHEAIRQWYHRAAGLFSLETCERDALAIDETKMRIDGEWRIVWAAIDVERWDILAVWVTQGRSSLEAYSSSSMPSGNVQMSRPCMWIRVRGINRRWNTSAYRGSMRRLARGIPLSNGSVS